MSPWLLVDREEFVQALRLLAKQAKRKNVGDAIFGYSDGMLRVYVGGVSATAAATGDWSGQARVFAGFVLAAAAIDLTEVQVSLRVEGIRLCLERFSADCVWQTDESELIRLPINPSVLDILALTLGRSASDIRRSGIEAATRTAEERRDTLIGQAIASLTPLGVTPTEVNEVVERAILRASKGSV